MRTMLLPGLVLTAAAAACSSGDDTQQDNSPSATQPPARTNTPTASASATVEAWDAANGPVWAAQVCSILQAEADSVASANDRVDASLRVRRLVQACALHRPRTPRMAPGW